MSETNVLDLYLESPHILEENEQVVRIPITGGGRAGKLAIFTSQGNITSAEELPEVVYSGDYNDLGNKPTLSDVSTSGDYNDLNNLPSLSTIASSGSAVDLLDKNTLFDGNTVVSSTNLNNLITSGNYAISGIKTNIPSDLPGNSAKGLLRVFKLLNDSTIIQMLINVDTNGVPSLYIRTKTNTWHNWTKI